MRRTHTELFLRQSLKGGVIEKATGAGAVPRRIHSRLPREMLEIIGPPGCEGDATVLVLPPAGFPTVVEVARIITSPGKNKWVHRPGEGFAKADMEWLSRWAIAGAFDCLGLAGDLFFAPPFLLFLWFKSERTRRRKS